MQTAISKTLFFGILFFAFSTNSAQTRLSLKTPEAFSVFNVKVEAWTPWGIEITMRADTAHQEFLISKACNRIRITGRDYITVDSVFIPEINENSRIVLTITPKMAILDEAAITASRSEPLIKHSSVSLSIVKPYLFLARNPTDAGQLISIIPGVSVADNQINIRNGSGWSYGAGSRVMVLVDDLPMLSPDAQAAQLTFIPLEQMQSIEVVKSAGSVLYGSSALNGVVNMRSREATVKPFIRIAAFSGFFDNPSNDSLKWSPNKRWASGSYGVYSQKFGKNSVTTGFNVLNNAGYRMNEFEKRARLNVRISHESTAVKGLKYGLNSSVQTGESGSFLLWEKYSQGYIPLDSGFNKSKSTKASFDPVIKYDNGKFHHAILGRILLIDNQIDNGNPNNNQSNGSSLWYSEYRNSTEILKHLITLNSGIVLRQSETHSALFSGKQTSGNQAVYSEAGFRHRKWILNAGARYEWFTLNQTKQSRPVLRTGLNFAATKTTYLRASWGQGYRFPSMAEAFTSTSAGPVQVYPNPTLKPESGTNAEVGIKQGFRIGNFAGYADLAAYRTVLQNQMEFTFAQWADFTAPLLGLGFKSVNTAPARIQGFEFEIMGLGKIHRTDIKLITGYTYSSPVSLNPNSVFVNDYSANPLTFANTRADSNIFLKYRYRHLFKADVQVERGKWMLGGGVQYNSRLLNMDNAFAYNIEQFAPGIERSWKTSKPAVVVDMRLAVNASENIRLQLQVQNLTNAVYLARPADIRPPRSFQFQVLYTPLKG